MDDAYKLTPATAYKESRRAKVLYDRKVYGVELYPGCRMLICGPGKLRSYWEDQVYIVTQRKQPENPVYELE